MRNPPTRESSSLLSIARASSGNPSAIRGWSVLLDAFQSRYAAPEFCLTAALLSFKCAAIALDDARKNDLHLFFLKIFGTVPMEIS
jgi:hypothetical protein